MRLLYSLMTLLFAQISFAQVANDLKQSVPVWLEYNSDDQSGALKWLHDDNADNYVISTLNENPFQTVEIETIDSSINEYSIGALPVGETESFHLSKNFEGTGVITLGLEVPPVHFRGRCLIAIDDTLLDPLNSEIEQLMLDMEMDGWEVDTMAIKRTVSVVDVKEKVVEWYDESYELSQTLFILGHVAVPYSGNSAYDGHSNHQGAWAADVFYGEMTSTWTDDFVNNTTPSRPENDNIPGDGKYDNSFIPSTVEVEVGRADFYNLPAFPDDEVELTRQYLNKNHSFRVGEKDYPRRGLVENNFAGFEEAFGQSGWRNFSTMFGGDSVSIQDYNVILESEKYLFSYACGAGSYTSCGGVGNTSNLWVAKDIQTVFTMTFGSYFGDWDIKDNFLRAALASGDVLTNAWSGRPIWQFYPMALGKHIGYCAKLTQNAPSFIFDQGYGSTSAHVALMGDPTLRLHAMKPASFLNSAFDDGNITLNWTASSDATEGYFVYKKMEGEEWEIIGEYIETTTFTDTCVKGNMSYEYMVKACKLEDTGSGTYYNTSTGITTSILVGDNPFINVYFQDNDNDGYGNPDSIAMACVKPEGYTDNDLDCNDEDETINPDGVEIANNGIDEDCDGSDFMVSTDDVETTHYRLYPNPANNKVAIINLNRSIQIDVYNVLGEKVFSARTTGILDVSKLAEGVYYVVLYPSKNSDRETHQLVIAR